MNTRPATDQLNESTPDIAAAAVEALASATGPMFTNDDTTDNPGVAPNGEPPPAAGNDAVHRRVWPTPVGGAAGTTEIGRHRTDD
jgi:hypothetical protein